MKWIINIVNLIKKIRKMNEMKDKKKNKPPYQKHSSLWKEAIKMVNFNDLIG